MLRRLWSQTIWYPTAIPVIEGQLARDVKRWVLPTVDAFLILGSLLGVHGGLPTFTLVYSESVSQVSSVVFLVVAVGCLVGVAFPRLWVLELVCKCGLVVLLATYALLLLLLAAAESPSRGFVAGIALALTVVPVWRIVWLGRESRVRRVLAAMEG